MAASTQPIPRKIGTTPPDSAIKDTPLNDKLRVRALLTNLGWDRTTKSLHLPSFTKNGEWIYRNTDRAGINEAMVNMFTNIPRHALKLCT